MVRLFFLSFFALWNFEFPAKIKKGGGEDPPDPLPMEVILRVTVVVKKMMVVMKHWVLLQQLPANTTTKNVPTIAEKNKTQVLTTA